MRASIRRVVVVAAVLCLVNLVRQLSLHDWEEWRSSGYSPGASVDVPAPAPLNATALPPADGVANPPSPLPSASAATNATAVSTGPPPPTLLLLQIAGCESERLLQQLFLPMLERIVASAAPASSRTLHCRRFSGQRSCLIGPAGMAWTRA
jgi:hypothetical protein